MNGIAEVDVPMPANPAVLGAVFYSQGARFDAIGGVLRLTNNDRVTLVP